MSGGNNKKYIRFNTGAISPKNPIQASSSNMKFMQGWKKQGKDYDIVRKINFMKKGGVVGKQK